MKNLNAIYSETYNFVYLRAKSILHREEDIQQLIKEVYMKAADEDVREDRLYQWLGKHTYLLGCSKYRKKKVSEIDGIELSEQLYKAPSDVDLEKTREVICDTLEDLPDMYQATLYAFYHDHMKIKDIASVMGYSVEAILNRLDYAHKYLIKVLEDYEEENNIGTRFSVEAVLGAMEDWSETNRMSDAVAQNVYGIICRELGIQMEEIETEDNIAGADKRVADCGPDVMGAIAEELENYKIKPKRQIKPSVVVAGIVVVLGVLALVSIFAFGKAKDKANEKKPESSMGSNVQGETDDIGTEENTGEEETVDESEYILPNSAKVRLTREDLQGLSKEQLRLARNEIYARYGVIFGPTDLQEYFGSKSWYQPRITFDEFDDTITMSDIEGANVSLIVSLEDEME